MELKKRNQWILAVSVPPVSSFNLRELRNTNDPSRIITALEFSHLEEIAAQIQQKSHYVSTAKKEQRAPGSYEFNLA